MAGDAAVEASSLAGTPLCRRDFAMESRRKLEDNLRKAEADYSCNPDQVDSIVWLARRLGYLDRYQEAIAVLDRGIQLHPAEPQLYRHRGHRYITVRRYQAAVADFERAVILITTGGSACEMADKMEPDGAPNAAGIPTSTLHTNIYYHLGLARFLLGQYDQAVLAYRAGLACELCTADMRIAFSDWLFMALRRLGRHTEATAVLAGAGDAEAELIEDFAYQKRLQLYRGELEPEEVLTKDADPLDVATQGFGVADQYLHEGKTTEALALLQQIAEGSYWPSFAACAAEADLQHLLGDEQRRPCVLYFIRHAHGRHNEAAETAAAEYSRLHRAPDHDGAPHPAYVKAQRMFVWSRMKTGNLDADLTLKGVQQLQGLQPQAEEMVAHAGVELVISSSMRRTLRTAVEPFSDLGVPFVAYDELREVAGRFECERRRPLNEISDQFGFGAALAQAANSWGGADDDSSDRQGGAFQIGDPGGVDLSQCSATDNYWVEDRDLATRQAHARAVAALDLIWARPERAMAVVSHGAIMAELFRTPHPRVIIEGGKMEPPIKNVDVVAVTLRKRDDGVFILSSNLDADALAVATAGAKL